jgi:outer membrane lipase/esterase
MNKIKLLKILTLSCLASQNTSFGAKNNDLQQSLTPIQIETKKFDHIFIFGDSLSDTGNTYRIDFGLMPISPPYKEGHWTNDLVWHEFFAEKAHIPKYAIHNFAFGGASAIQGQMPLPSLDKQVNTFLSWNKTADPNALYSIWIGGNDFLLGNYEDPNAVVFAVVNQISSQIEILIDKGARYFIVPSLPDLGLIPRSYEVDEKLGNHVYSKKMHRVSIAFQQAIEKMAHDLSYKYNNVVFVTPRVLDLANKIISEPTQFNITYVKERCNPNGYADYVKDFCKNPDEYMFWDDIHPSSHTHKIIAEILSKMLSDQGFEFDKTLMTPEENIKTASRNRNAVNDAIRNYIVLNPNLPIF